MKKKQSKVKKFFRNLCVFVVLILITGAFIGGYMASNEINKFFNKKPGPKTFTEWTKEFNTAVETIQASDEWTAYIAWRVGNPNIVSSGGKKSWVVFGNVERDQESEKNIEEFLKRSIKLFEKSLKEYSKISPDKQDLQVLHKKKLEAIVKNINVYKDIAVAMDKGEIYQVTIDSDAIGGVTWKAVDDDVSEELTDALYEVANLFKEFDSGVKFEYDLFIYTPQAEKKQEPQIQKEVPKTEEKDGSKISV